jgi:hypothetical protein
MHSGEQRFYDPVGREAMDDDYDAAPHRTRYRLNELEEIVELALTHGRLPSPPKQPAVYGQLVKLGGFGVQVLGDDRNLHSRPHIPSDEGTSRQ